MFTDVLGSKSKIAAGALLLAIIPSAVFAHVRWFTDPNDPALATFPTYSLTDTHVLVWIGISLVMILAAIALDGRLPRISIVDTKYRHDAIQLLRIFTGISLLLTAYSGALIAPHMVAYGGLGTTLLFAQAILGIMLMANLFIHHAAILLILLVLGTMVQYGFLKGLEYINFIGIALYLFFNFVPDQNLRMKLKPYSVDTLRIFTGIAFITLGVTEKITGAVLGQSFVDYYNWNFMQMLGFEWFTDQLLVLSAGAVEVTMGIILVLGVVTRLTIIAISAVMFASNIAFLLMGLNEPALVEFVGHMPLIATAILLMLLGYGQRLKVDNPTLNKPKSPTLATTPAE
ncbi:MAG: DoxX family membrane protein [Pseudomonadota bacterium]